MSRLRFFIRHLHLWLGLGVGLLFVLMGLSGAALVFYEDIDRLLHPELRVATHDARGVPGWEDPVWDRALATVQARWPDRTGAWRFEATGEPGAIPARYQAPGEGHHGRRIMVWLTPDGGRVLREDTWGSYAMTWIYDLHMELLMHAPGRAFVGWSGLVMLVLLLSGLWAWWPKDSWRAALHFKREAVPSRRLRDLHKWAGLLSMPLLLMLVLTGVMLALPEQSNAVLAGTLGPVVKPPTVMPASSHEMGAVAEPHGDVHAEPLMAPAADTHVRIGLTQALAAAHQAMPRARLAWVEAPGPGQGAYMVRVQQPSDPSHRFPHSYVFVDPSTGRVLATQDRERFGSSNLVNNWLHPLHDASIGGWPLRVLVLMAGLAPLFLWVTGLMRWWLRRRAHQRVASESRVRKGGE